MMTITVVDVEDRSVFGAVFQDCAPTVEIDPIELYDDSPVPSGGRTVKAGLGEHEGWADLGLPETPLIKRSEIERRANEEADRYGWPRPYPRIQNEDS